MRKTKKQVSGKAVTGKKQLQNQTLQKHLVTQVTRLFLILVATLIIVSGIFMYFKGGAACTGSEPAQCSSTFLSVLAEMGGE